MIAYFLKNMVTNSLAFAMIFSTDVARVHDSHDRPMQISDPGCGDAHGPALSTAAQGSCRAKMMSKPEQGCAIRSK